MKPASQESAEPKYPQQSHPNCDNQQCTKCLRDLYEVGAWISARLKWDAMYWITPYKTWLENAGISSETEHGWPTKEVFDPKNLEKFVTWWEHWRKVVE